MLIPIVLTLLAVAALLAAEYTGKRAGVWIAKPLASTGFVVVALIAAQSGASDPTYQRWIIAGLILSWWGDVLLIPKERPAVFRAGILAFLLGHVAYVVAFASRGLDLPVSALTAALVAAVAWAVLRWLRPHVPGDMRIPVFAYVGVISTMVVCAVGSVAEAGRPMIVVGGLMFYLSDLAVARDRFVAPGFANGAWGLPLYYGAQLVLASSIH
jgi:uncharacterized membrane protein YhhN